MALTYKKGSVAGILIEIGADTTELAAALNSAYQDANKLERELRSIDRALKADPGSSALLSQRYDVLGSAVTATEEKLKLLREAQERTQEAFQKGEASAEQYRSIERQVELTENRLKNLNKEIKAAGNEWTIAGQKLESVGKKISDVGKTMEGAGKTLSKTVTAPIAAIGTLSAKAAMDFETAMTGVRKTTDLTNVEFAGMSDAVRRMATEIPASVEEIARVAELAGQLGIDPSAIMDFTRTVIDLGIAAEDLSTEQAAMQMAKFANITRMSQGDFDRLGSVIAHLGNNTKTTEGDMLLMSMRLAAAGTQVGLTQAEILGLAASLSSAGVEAQLGGTAFSKLMQRMQTAVETSNADLAKFANVAGMSSAEFKKAFEEDAAGALSAFMEGLTNTELHGKSAIVLLDEMGIKEANLRRVLLSLAGAQDDMAATMKMGNEAWEENIALTKEAALFYETDANKLQVAKNRMNDVAITIGQELSPRLVELADWLAKAVEKFSNLDAETQRTIISIAGIAAALGPVLLVGGKITGAIGSIVSSVGALAKAIGGAGGLASVLTGPAGIIALVGALAAAVIAYSVTAGDAGDAAERMQGKIDKSNKKYDEGVTAIKANADETLTLINRVEELNGLEELSAEQKRELAGAVTLLNQKYPHWNLELDENTGKLKDSTDAMREYIAEMVKVELMDEHAAAVKRAYELMTDAAEEHERALRQLDEAEAARDKPLAWGLSAEEEAAQIHAREFAVETAKALVTGTKEAHDLAVQNHSDTLAKVADIGSQTAEILGKSAEDTTNILDRQHKAQQANAEAHVKEEEELEARRLGGAKAYLSERIKIAEDFIKDQKQKQKELEDQIKSHHDKTFSLDKEGLKNSELTLQKAMENLQKQITDYREWSVNMLKLTEMIPQDMYAYLEELGPAYGGLIAELVNATDADLKVFIALWQETWGLSSGAVKDEMKKVPAHLRDGIQDGTAAMLSEKRAIYNAGYDVGWSGYQGMKDGSAGTRQIGIDMADGIKAGIRAKAWDVAAEGEWTVKQAIRSMRNVALTYSPSRVTMAIGEDMGEGLIVGFRNMQRDVGRASGEMTEAALRGMSDPFTGLDWTNQSGAFSMPETTLSQRQFIVTGNEFVIREEADIAKITDELQKQVRRQERQLV